MLIVMYITMNYKNIVSCDSPTEPAHISSKISQPNMFAKYRKNFS